ncbi:MAG: choline ABC transporter substrate-binding protein [Rhizobiaceae bacterium]
MLRLIAAACMLTVFAIGSQSLAAEAESCKKVRLAEPGWNDLTFTTGTAMVLLKSLGYEAETSTLGIEVIYQALKEKDLDAYLGYWDPSMVTYYKPFKEEGSIETVRVNLTGAKYTFAVPAYVWEAGVKDFKDLAKFADKFDRKMYGIDAGSNQPMVDSVAEPSNNLSGWEVVESSEAGMLTEVARKVKNQEFIVFLGWAPHPMNTTFDMKYLTGGDKYFGPDFGAATVSTQARKGYLEECPNVGQLLKNLEFDIDYENKGMGLLINDSLPQEEAAKKMIEAEPQRLDKWLAGVTTVDGQPGLAAVKTALGL